MPGFDWRTEEKGRDSAPLVIYRDRPRDLRWLRRWTAVLIFGVAVFFIYTRLTQWVEATVTELETSPLASLNVMQRAVAETDEGLFNLVLSRRYGDWFADQQILFTQNLVFDRRPLGLYLDSAVPRLTNVDLSPELNRATVTYDLTYISETGTGITQTIDLQQTAVFENHDQRWLLSKGGADFWGGWEHLDGKWLTLTFPQRDADLAARLAADLDQQLADLCQTLVGINCPSDFHIRVWLRKEPVTLAQMAVWETTLASGREINLPSPTLVGVSVDEAGYQALYRGYAAPVVTAVIADLTEWQCCQRILFYEALLDKELNQLGLRPWPLTTADYDTILSRYFRLPEIHKLWQASSTTNLTEADHWRVYTFVDFLSHASPNMPLAEMQRQLFQAPGYLDWSRQFTNRAYESDTVLKREWVRFVYEQTSLAHIPSPIPLPEQNIHLYCLSESHHELYQYDWGDNDWLPQRSLDKALDGLISPLPGKDGLILYEHTPAIVDQTWTIIRPNEAAVVLPVELDSVFSTANNNPVSFGDKLLTGHHDLKQNRFQFTLLDLDSCDSTHCDSIPLPGLPVWSPDGVHTIVSLMHDNKGFFQLALGDSEGQFIRPIGSGSNPFWIDNETLGYLRTDQDNAEVVVTTINDDEPLFRLAADELLQALAEEAQATDTLAIRQIMSQPTNPQLLVVDTAVPAQHTQYIFTVDRLSHKIDMILQLDDRYGFIDFRFSPDGRWFTLTTYDRLDPVDATWSVYLHDMEQHQTTLLAFNPISYPTHSYDWSDDGQWFLKVEDGFITLLAPAYDYYKMLFFDAELCNSAVWVHERLGS